MLARLANWRRIGRSNEFVPAAPPTGLVKSLLATPDPALPVLAGIVATPVFGRNGALLTEPGYHAEAKLLYHPESGFQLPSIPERPTGDDIAQASALILDDLLGEFPFVSEAERAHAIALLLLGFVRAMIDGPTPLHLIEKPEAGTGAGLMIDIIATIVTGRPVSVMTASDNDEEWRKRITAKLRQMPAMAVIDNINNEIDSAALAAALTAPFWEDRILGVSEIVRIPIRCVWVATGNNPQGERNDAIDRGGPATAVANERARSERRPSAGSRASASADASGAAAAENDRSSKPAERLRAEFAEIAAIAAQALRLGVAVDAADAVAKGVSPDPLRRSVLDTLAARVEATSVIATAPSTTIAGDRTIVRRAKEALRRFAPDARSRTRHAPPSRSWPFPARRPAPRSAPSCPARSWLPAP